QGFAARVAPLDDYAGQLPREGAVMIATASYNGTPPDNAVQFCDWLRGGALESGALEGVSYAVFGCGNQDCASTFQAIPRLIDDKLAEYGARRITPRGEGDARDDFDGQFHTRYKALVRAGGGGRGPRRLRWAVPPLVQAAVEHGRRRARHRPRGARDPIQGAALHP